MHCPWLPAVNRREDAMTIGIGLLCQSGKCILMGADKRGTYEFQKTANDECGKLFDLPFGFYGAIAGTIGYCEPVISELGHRMELLNENERSVEYIKRELRSALLHTHIDLVQAALMQRCALTLNLYWKNKKIAPDLRQYAQNVIESVQLPVQTIIGGFCRGTPILLVSNGLEILEEVSPGKALIGGGAQAALYWLAYRRQNLSMSVQRSYLHLVEAKTFAETEKTVGPIAQYILITKDGWKPLEGQDAFITDWERNYGLQSSAELDSEDKQRKFISAFSISQSVLE
jgi:hypothetical protein